MELALALVGLVLFAAAVAVGARSAMRDRRERIEMAAGDAERQQFCDRLRSVVTHDEPLTEEAAVALREQLRVDRARDPHAVFEIEPPRTGSSLVRYAWPHKHSPQVFVSPAYRIKVHAGGEEGRCSWRTTLSKKWSVVGPRCIKRTSTNALRVRRSVTS